MVLGAYILGAQATDNMVKWTVGGTEGAVELYTDKDCTQPVGTDPTTTFIVYVLGKSVGEATVTVTVTPAEGSGVTHFLSTTLYSMPCAILRRSN